MDNYLIPLITVETAAVHIQELVENIPDLAVLAEPLLIVRRVLREQIVILHRRLLALVQDGAISFADILTSVSAACVSSRYRFLNT
jgi:transposase